MWTKYWKTSELFGRTRRDLCRVSSITRGWKKSAIVCWIINFTFFGYSLTEGYKSFRQKRRHMCHYCPHSGPPSTTTAYNGTDHKLLKSSAHSYIYCSLIRLISPFSFRPLPHLDLFSNWRFSLRCNPKIMVLQ